MKIVIEIPEKIPTINHLFWHRGNMKILKTEARELRERIVGYVEKNTESLLFEATPTTKLKVSVEVYENWYTKKGIVKRKDISNREKFLTDSVFKALKVDDKHIFEYTMRKIQSETEERVRMIVETMEE